MTEKTKPNKRDDGGYLYLIEQEMVIEVEVEVPALESTAGDIIEIHTVDLEVFECPNCCGALGIDSAFLDQVRTELKCPYCGTRLKLWDPDEDVKPK